MKLNSLKSARGTILLFGIVVYMIKYSWGCSTILPSNAYVGKCMTMVFLLAMALSMVLDVPPKEYLLYGAILALAAYSTHVSRISALFLTVVTVLAIRKEDLTKIIRSIRLTATAYLIVHTIFFLYLLLLGRQPLFTIDPVGRSRASLGFGHPNTLSIFVFNLILLWVWEKYDSIGTKQIVCLFAVATGMYKLTDTRTAYLCTAMLCVLLWLIKHSEKAAQWTSLLAKWIIPALTVVVLVLSALWKNHCQVAIVLNRLLSGRIVLSAFAIENFGFTLFGQRVMYGMKVPEWNIEGFTFDCVYSCAWSNMGIIWLLLLSLCFYKLGKLRNPKISLTLIVWAVYAITELVLLSVYQFFPLLLISILFLPGEEQARRYPPIESTPGSPQE